MWLNEHCDSGYFTVAATPWSCFGEGPMWLNKGPCYTDGGPPCSSSLFLARLGPNKILLIRQYLYGLDTESVINGTKEYCDKHRGGYPIFFSRHSYMFLDSFAIFQKATVIFIMCVCLSICPHSITRLHLDEFSWNLIFENCLEICREKKFNFH